MAQQEFSIPALMGRLRTEADAYKLLEDLRWCGQPVCPHCGSVAKHYFLTPANGSTRATRTGSMSERRVWKCKDCRRQFTVLVGTVFHGTKIPIRTWCLVVIEMCASKNGVSAREIERKYDLTPKTAWFMLHRIREAMKRDELVGPLSGTVAADETWVGGKPGNMSKSKRPKRQRWEYGKTDKPAVFALVDTRTGEVRSRVIPDVKGHTLRAAVAEEVEMGATTLVTDEAKGYKSFRGEMKDHQTVVHSREQYVNDSGLTTNQVEAFFGQLKRSIDGTHHHVSRVHLPRYLAQHDFLRTTFRLTDSDRMRVLMEQVGGRRLTYKPLAGQS